MATHPLRFWEIVETLEQAGFDVVDEGGMPLGTEMQGVVDSASGELMDDPVEVVFHEDVEESERAVLAHLMVRGHVFQVIGDVRDYEAARSLLTPDDEVRRGIPDDEEELLGPSRIEVDEDEELRP